MQKDEKPARMRDATLDLKDGGTVGVMIFEDTAVERMTNGQRVGVFGWTSVSAQDGKIGSARDWPVAEAPSFEDQCQVILDDIIAKLNGEVA